MLIAIFGESCTGKSTLAARLQPLLDAEVCTGRDYLRLAKNEAEAEGLFKAKLWEAVNGPHLIYVIAEKSLLAFVPEGAVRILVTADLAVIKERFAKRMHGNLPAPVAAMLERDHGRFDGEPCDLQIISGQTEPEAVLDLLRAKGLTLAQD